MGAENLLTPSEAADRLRVCTKTLRRLRRDGLIRYVAVTPRKIFYRAEDCEAYLAARTQLEQPQPFIPPRPRARTGKRKAGNVVSFTERRRERLGATR